MSTNTKTIIVSLVLLLAVGYGGVRLYKASRPQPRPIKQREEVTLTIIPGWNLRQVAEYLVLKGFASSTQQVYDLTGTPAVVGPSFDTQFCHPKFIRLWCEEDNLATLEGYVAPETFRVFVDTPLSGVLLKFLDQREDELFSKNRAINVDFDKIKRSKHEIMTMASIIEHAEDRAIVADILWRRIDKNWALQVDSSVHYIVDRTGDVFTTEQEREIDSPWNTYKYPGLPPGPICNPSVESINAALYPKKNNYWYFLSGKDGKMYYARTLEEHNANKVHL